MFFNTIALADEAATTATQTGAQGGMSSLFSTGGLVSILPFILIFVFMYMLLIRPQRKKEKELKEKISQMKVGDKVVSIGGIIGKVYKIKDDFIIMETGNLGTQEEKSFLKFEKSAIRDIITK